MKTANKSTIHNKKTTVRNQKIVWTNIIKTTNELHLFIQNIFIFIVIFLAFVLGYAFTKH